MANEHQTRTVLITGASTGIGKICALHLAEHGHLVFAGVRRPIDGEILKQESAGRVRPVILDVTNATTISQARATLEGVLEGQGLSGLVNNAGIVTPAPLELSPLEEIKNTIDVNLVGLIAVTQAFIPLLRSARGRIVNIGSVQSRQGIPYMATYSATKSALKGLTEALRLELRPWGIDVILVEPGSIATPIWDKGFAAWDQLDSRSPSATQKLYGDYSRAMRKAVTDVSRRGISPLKVAMVVERALTARRAATVYLVGLDARILAILAWLLPGRTRDALFMKMNGLPSST